MTREQLLEAKPGIVSLIRDQGERRLENQCSFMDALDVKGSALLTGSSSLAAAAAAVASGAAALKPPLEALIWGGTTSAIGFTVAAILAVISQRSSGFHSVGWFPRDFAADLENEVSMEGLEADFVVALQPRLSENRKILARRGDLQDWGSYVLLGTPLAALITAYVMA
jgi:hypothetical protein